MNPQLFGSPPTDNLYKFMALCGLIVFILSIGYPKKLILDANYKVQEISAEKEKFQLKHQYLKKNIESDIEKYKNRELDSESLVAHKKSLLEHEILLADYDHSVKKLEVLNEHINEVGNYGLIGSIFGGLSMLLGFSLWYLRVQKPADKKVLQEISATASPKPPVPPPSSA